MENNNRDTRLFYWLNVAQRRVLAAVDQAALDDLGVTSAQLGVLYVIGRREGVTLKEIGAVLALGAPGATGLVNRMEKQGLVTRQPDPEDGRAVRVVLTRTGRNIRARSLPLPLLTAMNAAITDEHVPEDIAATLRVLKTLARRFDDAGVLEKLIKETA